jgi:hypothetical protein
LNGSNGGDGRKKRRKWGSGKWEVDEGLECDWARFELGEARQSAPGLFITLVRPCLDASKFQKFYKIPCHIKSLDACMKL